jgi:hypothetical protein
MLRTFRYESKLMIVGRSDAVAISEVMEPVVELAQVDPSGDVDQFGAIQRLIPTARVPGTSRDLPLGPAITPANTDIDGGNGNQRTVSLR